MIPIYIYILTFKKHCSIQMYTVYTVSTQNTKLLSTNPSGTWAIIQVSLITSAFEITWYYLDTKSFTAQVQGLWFQQLSPVHCPSTVKHQSPDFEMADFWAYHGLPLVYKNHHPLLLQPSIDACCWDPLVPSWTLQSYTWQHSATSMDVMDAIMFQHVSTILKAEVPVTNLPLGAWPLQSRFEAPGLIASLKQKLLGLGQVPSEKNCMEDVQTERLYTYQKHTVTGKHNFYFGIISRRAYRSPGPEARMPKSFPLILDQIWSKNCLEPLVDTKVVVTNGGKQSALLMLKGQFFSKQAPFISSALKAPGQIDQKRGWSKTDLCKNSMSKCFPAVFFVFLSKHVKTICHARPPPKDMPSSRGASAVSCAEPSYDWNRLTPFGHTFWDSWPHVLFLILNLKVVPMNSCFYKVIFLVPPEKMWMDWDSTPASRKSCLMEKEVLQRL